MSPLVTRMCTLLAGLTLATLVPAQGAEAPPEDAARSVVARELEEVVIYATSGEVVAGIYAESELDEAGIAAYGANTVGDLLTQISPDVDNSAEGPIILVNGKPANGIRSVNDLPPESILRVEVLPPLPLARAPRVASSMWCSRPSSNRERPASLRAGRPPGGAPVATAISAC